MTGGVARLVGAIVGLLLVVAPAAIADGDPLEVALPRGGLGAIAYGGGRVLWATNPVTGPVRVYSTTPGGSASKLLASIPREGPDDLLAVSLSAGESGYIVSLRSSVGVDAGPYGAEIVEGEVVALGGFDGSLHTVLRCRPGKASRELEFPPVATAAANQLFAFAGIACGAPASIDTVTPQGTVTPMPHSPRFTFNAEEHEVEHVNLTLAGSTLAYTASDAKELPLIGVDDLASGGYRQIDPLVGGITSLSARADGTVFATGTVFASEKAKQAEPASVFALDPAQSTLRPLTGLHSDEQDTMLAGGERLLLDSGGFPDLTLATASGEPLGPVGLPGVSGTHELLAFSGEQAAYTSSTCTGLPEVTVLTLPATGPTGSTQDGCPMSAGSSKLTVGRRGRAAVRVTCPLGCKGRLELRAGHHDDVELGTGAFALPSGPGLVHLRLDREARRFLARHHGHLTAELSSDTTDPEMTASIAAVKVVVSRG